MRRNSKSQAADPSLQTGDGPLRNIADDELRKSFRAAQRSVSRLMGKLDAAGGGSGRAMELVDEGLEILGRAETAHYATTRARTTEAVLLAVDRARAARAARGRARERG